MGGWLCSFLTSTFCWCYYTYKNIERHTANTVVSWPNGKQWKMGHIHHVTRMLHLAIVYDDTTNVKYWKGTLRLSSKDATATLALFFKVASSCYIKRYISTEQLQDSIRSQHHFLLSRDFLHGHHTRRDFYRRIQNVSPEYSKSIQRQERISA